MARYLYGGLHAVAANEQNPVSPHVAYGAVGDRVLPTRGDGCPWLLGFGLAFVAFLPLGKDAVAVFCRPVEVILDQQFFRLGRGVLHRLGDPWAGAEGGPLLVPPAGFVVGG